MSQWARLLVPADHRETTARIVGALLSGGLSFVVGYWECSGPNSNSYSPQLHAAWTLCGVVSTCAAGLIAAWVGFRRLFLVPLLLPALTAANSLVSGEVAGRLGYTFDPLTGIDLIGLTFFAGIEGILLVPVIWLVRFVLWKGPPRGTGRHR